MSEIHYRLAKPSDARQLANCHWSVRDRYTQGIFLSLGKTFLEAYYKVVLDDPWEVVLCAEKEDGAIVGFKSTTLNAVAQAKNLQKHKVYLGFAAIKALLFKPSLIKDVWQRYQSLKGDKNAPQFVHTDGVRAEYWCWLPGEDSLKTFELNKMYTKLLCALDVKEVFFEVDKFNKEVYKFHLKVTKAEPLEEMTLPDGRVRVLFKKVLKNP